MAFSTTKFPVQAWKLMPSFKPVEVTVIGEPWKGGFATNNSSWVSSADLFHTKAAAIAAGRDKLIAQQARIDKMQAAITKKRAALEKAEVKP